MTRLKKNVEDLCFRPGLAWIFFFTILQILFVDDNNYAKSTFIPV